VKVAATTELTRADEKAIDNELRIIEDALLLTAGQCLVVGGSLTKIKGLLPHGGFIPWVEENCPFTTKTAQNYMRAFEVFGKYERLSYLDPSAMYLLASSEPAATEAKSLASKGHRITEAKAKELVAKHKPPKLTAVAPTSANGLSLSPVVGVLDSLSSNGAAAAYACPNCHGHESDDDGDCAKCLEPAREPGDDTDAIAAEVEKRRNSGSEVVSKKKRTQAAKDFGHVCAFLLDGLKRHDLRPQLEFLMAVIKGEAE
jgi:hypothetical protein